MSRHLRRLARPICSLMLCFAVWGGASAEPQPLTTAPLDYSVFRPGAVKRIERKFGTWILSCDEIASLSRKFCSLRGLARTPDGTIMADLTVSTDDRGHPTALVRLPFGVIPGTGTLVVRPADKRPPVLLDLRPALCDGQGCQVIWSLLPEDIRALSAGAPLAMRFAMVTGEAQRLSPDPKPRRVAIAGALPTGGFAEALKASLN